MFGSSASGDALEAKWRGAQRCQMRQCRVNRLCLPVGPMSDNRTPINAFRRRAETVTWTQILPWGPQPGGSTVLVRSGRYPGTH